MTLTLVAILLLVPLALSARTQTPTTAQCRDASDQAIAAFRSALPQMPERDRDGARTLIAQLEQLIGQPGQRYGRVRHLAGDRPAGVPLVAPGSAPSIEVSRINRMRPPVRQPTELDLASVPYHRFTKTGPARRSLLVSPRAGGGRDRTLAREARCEPVPSPVPCFRRDLVSRAKSSHRH